MKQEVYISIEGGAVVNKTVLQKTISELKNGRYLFTIESKNKRTSPQNRYMHMMFNLIQKGFVEIGYRDVRDMETAKEIMKRMFLSRTIDNGSGGKIEIVRRTRDLTKEEMMQFIDECIQFAAENLSIVVPAPGTQTSIWEAEYDHQLNATIVQ